MTQQEHLERMRAVEERYNSACHSVEKHRRGTLALIKDYEQRVLQEFDSRQQGNAPSGVDHWTQFYHHDRHKTSGVTGVLARQYLRKFLEAEQGHLCCYCQRPLFNIANAKPIEHILPRSAFVQYSFHFWNLAVACVDCNLLKSDDVWLDPTSPVLRHYPQPDSFTDMYHPRFHLFADHVKFFRIQTNDLIISLYVGITAQGRALCNRLLRQVAAKEIVTYSNPVLKQSLNTINSTGEDLGEEALTAVEAFQSALAKKTLELVQIGQP
ncbi:HNH endonuclease [Pseudomonas putida]|uniref:HNH endonuclease n=1 Tax=Pseudomonas putida TaxID=303 RepID=UPI00383B6FAD